MSQPRPMQIPQALDELRQALQSVDGQPVDPMTAEWTAIERGIARLLGGAFNPRDPKHGGLAFLVAAALGERLNRDLGGFWFPNRAAPAGAAIGFQDALIVVSPIELTLQALARARLSLLDQVKKDLGEAIAQARASQPPNVGARKLQPEDYRRLFDPGLIQFTAFDHGMAEKAWRGTAAQAARDITDALGRLPARVPDEVRRQMKEQFVGTLERLDQNAPLASQITKAPPLLELVGLLYAQKETTRFAAAELWQNVLLPLLHIGEASDFPPLDDEDLEAYRKGTEPVLIFVETVPFRIPTADEDGLLGVFPPESLSLINPAFQGIPATRLLRASSEPLAKICDAFDSNRLRASIERFTAYLANQSGGQPPASPERPNAPPLHEVSLALLGELVEVMKAVRDGRSVLCLRRATEGEASSEGAIAELRQAIQTPSTSQ